jgi:hypothetical protein
MVNVVESPKRKRTPSERRVQVALGAKRGDSQRLMAAEFDVSGMTIKRDFQILGIESNKKPRNTRRKRAVAWNKISAPADKKVHDQVHILISHV